MRPSPSRSRLGILTHRHPANRGYGGNQKTCYALALERGADIVVMLHPDYQYEPRLITAMAAMVASDVYDVVIGSRILGNTALAGGMPRYKYIANRFLTAVQNLLVGSKLSEFHTGYRAFSRRVLETLPLAQNSDDFVFDNQMLVQAIAFGLARRRNLVSDALFRRSEPDQFPAIGRLRRRRAVDERAVSAVEMETRETSIVFAGRLAAIEAGRGIRLAHARMLNPDASYTLRDRRAWPWFALAVLAFVAGVWLRLYQLRTQTLIDDEWHAVRMLIGSDAAGIVTHFGYADHCIPLTLYYRWLYDLGVLSEWQMHLPLLIAGIALMVLAPLLLRGALTWPVRAVWLALLAISPVLVYLSRTARPYALDCLCAFVAIVAFHRWRNGGGRRWAVAYVVATVAAAWLHVLTVVFTLWPFVWFGLPALRNAWRRSTRAAGTRDIVRIDRACAGHRRRSCARARAADSRRLARDGGESRRRRDDVRYALSIRADDVRDFECVAVHRAGAPVRARTLASRPTRARFRRVYRKFDPGRHVASSRSADPRGCSISRRSCATCCRSCRSC